MEHPKATNPGRVLELLWRHEVPPSQSRGPKPALSVDQIIAAAIETADAGSLTSVTMRALSRRLAVSTMTLYIYIPSKAALVEIMVDAVSGETTRPKLEDMGWRDRLESIARENRALYERHAWLAEVGLSRPPLGPNVIAKYDYELRALDGLGLTDIEMDSVLTLILEFVRASFHAAQSASNLQRETAMTDEQWWAANAPLLSRVLDPSRYPIAARVGLAAGTEYGSAYSPSHAFEFGLQRLLDGVGALLSHSEPA